MLRAELPRQCGVVIRAQSGYQYTATEESDSWPGTAVIPFYATLSDAIHHHLKYSLGKNARIARKASYFWPLGWPCATTSRTTCGKLGAVS
jgi:hypothetical protein